MSKSVKFRRESPSGGSHYDHQRSDSGVGSFSDNESRTERPDRYSGSDFDTSYANITLISELQETRDARDKYKKKFLDAERQIADLRKELAEATAQRNALQDHANLLKDENANLEKANNALRDELSELKSETASNDGKRSSRRKSTLTQPTMSGALPAESHDDKKPRRSASKKRHSEKAEREKERERIDREYERERELEKEKKEKERETERLRKRFDTSRGEESDAKSSSTSSKSHRSRRDSYIEPLGHSAPRPTAQVPPSPSRPFAYTNAPYTSQPFQTIRDSSARPTVVVYSDPYDDEDGNYHAYPLPSHNKSRGRGER